jgi:hypothetical protein
MTEPNYKIEMAWPSRVETPQDIGKKFFQTLDALARIDPVFCDWGAVEDIDSLIGHPMEPLRQDFTPYVEAHVLRDDWGQPEPRQGYRLWASSGYRPYPEFEPRSMTLFVTAGSTWQNSLSLEAGYYTAPPDHAVVTYPIFKSALLTLIEIWPAPWANVQVSLWGQKPPTLPGEPPFPYSGYQMPWMSYLSAEFAGRITPPVEILTERTPDGGLLMIAAETRLDPTRRDHMARSRVLAEIMIEHGPGPH